MTRRVRVPWIAARIVPMVALCLPTPVALADDAPRLWYPSPARSWTEALPIGNGRLGAMAFGGVEEERLQFNEDTLWTGKPHEYHRVGAAAHLPEIRRLLAEGKQREAEDLAAREFMSVPLRQKAYQPFGDLRIRFSGHRPTDASEYRRELDLDSAVASVRYSSGGVTYERRAFSSFPDGSIVVRITASRPGSVSFSAALSSPHPSAAVRALGGDAIALAGEVEEGGLRFEARLRVMAEGEDGTRRDGAGRGGDRTDGNAARAGRGAIRVERDEVLVEGADAATLILVAATSHVSYRDISADPRARCEAALGALRGRSFDEILLRHIEDHRRLFRRVSLDLGRTPTAELPTDERVKAAAKGDDPALAALYFQLGRYLLIASSRPGCQPANLQGIWNDQMRPPWDSKWTTNINTEMNYWPAETTNLSECHEPLFDLIEDCVETGRKTAEAHYAARGWVLHHNTDLWRGTAPINAANHGIWPTGGAWLALHLWERWLFTGDEGLLARRAYPAMKEASLFFLDVLVEDKRTDRLISTPSNSPEQGGLVAGPAMDHQIIRALLEGTAEAALILGVDAELAETLDATRRRIAPDRIGRHGQLQEWLEDKDDPRNRHRHVSHLWALYPGKEITPRGTPDLAAAAKRSLEFRGDGGTGWSKAWKIGLWARLLDGDRALKLLVEALAGNTFPNLLDAHPPFQIDGNFGGTAGIAEMLLQSHAGEVELLPALPKAWASGSVRGLVARGGFEVDIAWSSGRLAAAALRSTWGRRCRVRLGEGTRDLEVAPGEEVLLDGKLRRPEER